MIKVRWKWKSGLLENVGSKRKKNPCDSVGNVLLAVQNCSKPVSNLANFIHNAKPKFA